MKNSLLTVAMLLAGFTFGNAVSTATATPRVETRVETEIVEVPAHVEIEVPTALPYDHASLDSDGIFGWERECNLSIAPLAPLANQLNTQMVCISNHEGALIESDYAGFYSGTVVILANEYTTFDYYAEVAAHELGHAFDFHTFTPEMETQVAQVMGWETYDLEHFADVFAYDLGYWADYGEGWRHDGGVPSQEQISTLRSMGLLPIR